MTTLRIVGDSFASTELHGVGKDKVWFSQLNDMLGTKLFNNSMLGAAQDFAWHSLHDWAPFITPDDYVVVILTHPARFWFLEDDATMGKADHIRELDYRYGKEIADAAEMYVRYIQRPLLDTLFLENRLGWLAYQTHFRKWRRPLIIKAFDQHITQAIEYPELNFANGNLTKVSEKEIIGGDFNKWGKGYDIRFNHLCLSNHKILAEKIHAALTLEQSLDLTQGFKENFLDESVFSDLEFIDKECNPDISKRRSVERAAKSLGMFNFLKR